MTESDRHRHANENLQSLLRKIGATIRANSGIEYQFPPIVRDGKVYPYIADTMAVWQGIPIVFEIDLHHHGTRQAAIKDRMRENDLKAFGCTIIRYTPLVIDDLDEAGLLADIAYYALKKKIVLEARSQ